MRSVKQGFADALGPDEEPKSGLPRPQKSTGLTRAQAARQLGIPYHRVRTLEGRLLHPKRDARGRLRFDRDELEQARKRLHERPLRSAEGELAARVAELLREGKTTEEIVVLLRAHPKLVREIRHELAEPDDLIVPGAVVASIEGMGFRGTGPKGRLRAEDLPALVTRLLAAARRQGAARRPGPETG